MVVCCGVFDSVLLRVIVRLPGWLCARWFDRGVVCCFVCFCWVSCVCDCACVIVCLCVYMLVFVLVLCAVCDHSSAMLGCVFVCSC